MAISPHLPENAGRSHRRHRAQPRLDPIDAVADYLVADRGETRIVVTSIDEADVREIARAPSGARGLGRHARSRPTASPARASRTRASTALPRVLGHYVARLGLLTLPRAVAKMTGVRPARSGLRDRGLLREGCGRTWPCSTPRRSPTARPTRSRINSRRDRRLVVNGEVVIDGGEHTGALPGRVLRRGPAGVA